MAPHVGTEMKEIGGAPDGVAAEPDRTGEGFGESGLAGSRFHNRAADVPLSWACEPLAGGRGDRALPFSGTAADDSSGADARAVRGRFSFGKKCRSEDRIWNLIWRVA